MAESGRADPARAVRNGKLSIPLPFDEAIRAALKVKPPRKASRNRQPKPRPKRASR
jgi:hypothetical protein